MANLCSSSHEFIQKEPLLYLKVLKWDPDQLQAKTFLNIEFPKGHVGVKSFDSELVDEEGNPIPSFETYLHHWFAIKYIQNITMSDDPKLRHLDDFSFKRNEGICNGNILPHYWGFGVESRGTTSNIPEPFAIEQGNPTNIPEGYEEKWLLNIMAIDTRGAEDKKGCTRIITSNGSEIIHDCRVEYTIPTNTNSGGDSPHVQKASIPMNKGGYLIYATSHMHSGVVNATLYAENGQTLCTSTPKYGSGNEAGNEKDYLIGMSICYPQLSSIKINDGEILTLESRYVNEFRIGVMGHFYIYLAENSATIMIKM
ncbi:hypothetical protein ACSQ67_020447 [Phaseolus vulgaris]